MQVTSVYADNIHTRNLYINGESIESCLKVVKRIAQEVFGCTYDHHYSNISLFEQYYQTSKLTMDINHFRDSICRLENDIEILKQKLLC